MEIQALPATVGVEVTLPTLPAVTFQGPVIGPEYTLPPTSTPRPTETPTEGPSLTPEPTDVPPTQGPQPTALPLLDRTRMGIQLDPNLSSQDWTEAAGRRANDDLRMGWIKIQVAWEQLQPGGPQDFGVPFQLLEQHLQLANGKGMNILVSVAKAPPWARSNQSESGPPDNPQLLADFINFMLTKFPFVDAVEVWNEPNLQREWTGTLPFNGAGYMQLFRPSYDAVQNWNGATGNNVRVVVAGLAPTGNNPGSRDDRQYLREMYANGLAQYGNVAVGVHPYSWANSPDATCCGTRGWDDDPHFFFADTMREYRDIMNANGHNVELWVTEFGWPTWQGFPNEPPEPWLGWLDKWQQANYTLRAFEIGQSTPDVGPMFLWNLNWAVLTGMVENRDERAAYSMVVPLNPAERPLYWMIYDAVRGDVELPRYD